MLAELVPFARVSVSLPAPRSIDALVTNVLSARVSLPAVPVIRLLSTNVPTSTSTMPLESCESGIACGWLKPQGLPSWIMGVPFTTVTLSNM